MTLEETLKQIKPLDEEKMQVAKKRWDSIAKPLHSLGKMEDLITQIVGMTGEVKVDITKKALVAMCADNGVVEEGVTQTGQEVTAIVADNFVKETTTACVMCHQCGVSVKPVDVGMVRDTTARTDLKVMYGTRNMTKGPAMTREEAIKGIEAGIAMAEELKEQGKDTTLGSFTKFPDILMMDGGKGQVNVALRVLDHLGLDIPVCGMVKDDDHRTRGLYYNNEEIIFAPNSEAFLLVTRIQDEAHRFAIEYHRSLRAKGQVHSVLDDIKGVGPKRRKELMKYFKDLGQIKTATVTELLNVPGMNQSTAESIYGFFHDSKQ